MLLAQGILCRRLYTVLQLREHLRGGRRRNDRRRDHDETLRFHTIRNLEKPRMTDIYPHSMCAHYG